MSKLRWQSTRGFFLQGTVRPDMSDKELEAIRARLLVGRDIMKNIGIAVFPHDIEGQIVELELLWEKVDPRTELEARFVFAFDHLVHTNC